MEERIREAWKNVLAGEASKFASGLMVSKYVQKSRDSKTGVDLFKDKIQIQTKNLAGRRFLQDFECVNPKDFELFEGKEIFFPIVENSFLGDTGGIVHYAKTYPVPPILLEELFSIFDTVTEKSNNQNQKTGTTFTPLV